MKIDSNAIRELAELLDETGLTEVEVADGDKAIRVSKGGAVIATAGVASAGTMSSDPAVPQMASMDTPPAHAVSSHPGAVKSPMVGTIYFQADPNAPQFVKKGDYVNVGDTLFIIEAMKVMNPIKAEVSGTVTQILVENSQPVEFGDVLLVIEE